MMPAFSEADVVLNLAAMKILSQILFLVSDPNMQIPF
jgi:hypothetical protein